MFIVNEYVKTFYRLTAVDLSRKKESDVDPKVFVGQLKNPYDAVVANKSTFLLTILENIKEKRLKFS